jgi:hypothetical protein
VVILRTTSCSIQQFDVPSAERVYVLCVTLTLSSQLSFLKEEQLFSVRYELNLSYVGTIAVGVKVKGLFATFMDLSVQLATD